MENGVSIQEIAIFAQASWYFLSTLMGTTHDAAFNRSHYVRDGITKILSPLCETDEQTNDAPNSPAI